MKRTLISLASLAIVFLSVSPALAAAPPTLKLPASYTDYAAFPAWASASISDASLWGIISGYPTGDFQPQGNITRAEFAKMLAVAMGDASPDPAQVGNLQPNQTVFNDTPPTSWYDPYVRALSTNGTLTTKMYPSGAFGPGQPITRAEAAAWISKGLGYFGIQPSGQSQTFSDVAASGTLTENGAVVPVADLQVASQEGVIKGYPDGTFQPGGSITRAEAAAMLTRFVQALPGYSALERQTSSGVIANLVNGIDNHITGPGWGWSSSGTTFSSGTATILTSADLTFTPAATEAAFQAEPTATWQQVHLWLATQNWISLGEAKLTSDEAKYVAGYGLEPWQVAEIAIVGVYYSPSYNESAMLQSLGTQTAMSVNPGPPVPVSSVALVAPDAPLIGNATSFVVNGTVGIFDGNVQIGGNGLVWDVQNANK